MKKVLITAGAGIERIDDVRFLTDYEKVNDGGFFTPCITNISSGKLGCEIAEEFCKFNYQVYYLCSKDAKRPFDTSFCDSYNISNESTGFSSLQVIRADSCADTLEVMMKLVPEMNIVIHSMAVCDFGFVRRDTPLKLKSNSKEDFLKFLTENMIVNPKILPIIKKWNPKVKLVSFKFESGLEHEELMKRAIASMDGASSDIVVANDLMEMKKYSEHIAHLVVKLTGHDPLRVTAKGKHDIAMKLRTLLELF